MLRPMEHVALYFMLLQVVAKLPLLLLLLLPLLLLLLFLLLPLTRGVAVVQGICIAGTMQLVLR